MIPGFRSRSKGKMVIAVLYYVISLIIMISSPSMGLFALALPFLLFGIIDLMKAFSDKNFSIRNLSLIIAGVIMFVISMNLPTDRIAESSVPDKSYVDISFFDMRDDLKSLTEQQFKEKYNKYEGKYITWEGYVDEVKENGDVLIDMDEPDDISLYDVRFKLDKDTARTLNKDDKIKFEGKINKITQKLSSLTVHLEDVTVK